MNVDKEAQAAAYKERLAAALQQQSLNLPYGELPESKEAFNQPVQFTPMYTKPQGNRRQRRAAGKKKTNKNPEIAQFARRVRSWTDAEIYKNFHRPVTQELIDTCAQDMIQDVVAVVSARLGDSIGSRVSTVLHEWYDKQDTYNTRHPEEYAAQQQVHATRLHNKAEAQGSSESTARHTNGERYPNATPEWVQDNFADNTLCKYCPLPEEAQGMHLGPNGPYGCEGRACDEAFEAWRDDDCEEDDVDG